MKKIVRIYDVFEEKLLALMLAVQVVVIFAQVVGRYCFNNSISWSEELARYLYIWQGWLGISYVERKREHITIDMLVPKFPGMSKYVIGALVKFFAIVIAIFMAYYGFQMVLFSLSTGVRSTALKLPLAYLYAAMPLSCVLYAIRVFVHMVEDLKKAGNTAEEGLE